MATKKCPTTTKVASMIAAAIASAPGGATVKSGVKAASTGSNSHTFATAFATTPRVVLTVFDSIALRDCLYALTAVSTTGFSFDVDTAANYSWIATDAGDI